jgi:hypothetical protein
MRPRVMALDYEALGVRRGAAMDKFWRAKLVTTTALLTFVLAGTPVYAVNFVGARLGTAAAPAPSPERIHCRPWPHWHPWRWRGGCAEIELPRERNRWLWRPHDWLRPR